MSPISKRADAGELRTLVYFKRIERTTDDEGFPKEKEVNVFGQDSDGRDLPAHVKWVNVHGYDVFTAVQLKLKEPATITMRYFPEISADMVVYKGTDPRPYEIISINNVEDRSRWLEIKVHRKVAAR